MLAEHLAHHRGSHPLVLGIPRGGVVVAAEVAAALGGSLDVVAALELGSPGSPELAIGAVAPEGVVLVEEHLVTRLGLTAEDLAVEVRRRTADVRRLQEGYRRAPGPGAAGRTVVVVDDGVATGITLRAVLAFVRRGEPGLLVCAVPVGPPATIDLIAAEVDEVVCPLQPLRMRSVGEWYEDFGEIGDAEVAALLEAAAG